MRYTRIFCPWRYGVILAPNYLASKNYFHPTRNYLFSCIPHRDFLAYVFECNLPSETMWKSISRNKQIKKLCAYLSFFVFAIDFRNTLLYGTAVIVVAIVIRNAITQYIRSHTFQNPQNECPHLTFSLNFGYQPAYRWVLTTGTHTRTPIIRSQTPQISSQVCYLRKIFRIALYWHVGRLFSSASAFWTSPFDDGRREIIM